MTDAAALSHLFLGRQPILDGKQTLIGYELLFRDSSINRAPAAGPGVATADVICKAFTELGLAKALNSHKAFVIVDEAFLEHDAIEALPPDSVVFELDAHLAASPRAVERCLTLRQCGYSFCLTHRGTDVSAHDSELLEQAMFVKLDVQALPEARLRELLAQAAPHRLITIASHVETHAEHRRATELGFQFFQGYYFAEPVLIEGRKLDPALQGLVRIIKLLNEDAELPAIEQAFKGEAALTVKLLRLTNSVGVGLRTRIGSVRQAINIIGRRPLQRWLQLLLFSHGDDAAEFERNPLMQLAALKGNFMERLARRCYPNLTALPDLAFLAGLMSLMPAALGLPMAEIVDQIAIAPQLRMALLAREGELGLLLDLTDSYDNDDPVGAGNLLAQLGNRVGRETLNQCLAESIAWVGSLGVEAD
ncbi:MAG: HDOD domain-containing protein [Pseudomonadota bacterium]